MTAIWREQAACIGKNNLFFPKQGETGQQARQICRACPVKQECFTEAMENGEVHGIWGDTDPDDRRDIRMGRKPGTVKARRAIGRKRSVCTPCKYPESDVCGTPTGYANRCRADACYEAESARNKQYHEQRKAQLTLL